MFTFNLSPDIFSIGWFHLRWYSLFYALGFILTWWFLKAARKRGAHSLSDDDLSDLITYLIVGVVLGARLFEVFVWEPSYYLSDPLKILFIWQGGLSFHGGLVGAIIAAYYFCKKKSFPLSKLFDLLAIPASFALALGRIGNFMNAELVGTVTNVPWCVKFPRDEGCRHPVQLYGALGRALMGILLYQLWKKKHKEGLIALVFVFLLGIGRFFTDFLRDDPRYFSLSMGQWLSLIMVVVSAVLWFRFYRSQNEKNKN